VSKRCAECGELIVSGSSVAKVLTGTYNAEDSSLAGASEADSFHQSCYNKSLGSPDSIMEELRHQSKVNK
jgi:hypothetical protein